MISAVQCSPVNCPKPQYNVTFGNKYTKLAKSGQELVENAAKNDKSFRSVIKGLPNTIEKFLCWFVDFKG
ncbi:hypothetical protein J6S88_02425 [bacterium]|nr:hypothetical protein [bacterium]